MSDQKPDLIRLIAEALWEMGDDENGENPVLQRIGFDVVEFDDPSVDAIEATLRQRLVDRPSGAREPLSLPLAEWEAQAKLGHEKVCLGVHPGTDEYPEQAEWASWAPVVLQLCAALRNAVDFGGAPLNTPVASSLSLEDSPPRCARCGDRHFPPSPCPGGGAPREGTSRPVGEPSMSLQQLEDAQDAAEGRLQDMFERRLKHIVDAWERQAQFAKHGTAEGNAESHWLLYCASAIRSVTQKDSWPVDFGGAGEDRRK